MLYHQPPFLKAKFHTLFWDGIGLISPSIFEPFTPFSIEHYGWYFINGLSIAEFFTHYFPRITTIKPLDLHKSIHNQPGSSFFF